MKIVITGSSGFLGKIIKQDIEDEFLIDEVSLRSESWRKLSFKNAQSLIHLAGIAHNKERNKEDYFKINRDLTLELALKAKAEGVKQFIFVSTIKVNGEGDTLITEDSKYNPVGPYAQSKMEAEQGLLAMESDDFRIVILRPPLIYGPGLKGNLLMLLKLCAKYPIIPLGKINNQRSMVNGRNISDMLRILLKKNLNGIFIPCDLKPYSTTYLIKKFSKLTNKSPQLLPIGPLKYIIKVVRNPLYSRLFGSFVIDNLKTRTILGWEPKHNWDTLLDEIKIIEEYGF